MSVITLDDSDPSISYRGDWLSLGNANEYNNTARYTQELGATATIRFNGNGITVIGSIPKKYRQTSNWLLDDGAVIPPRSYKDDAPNDNDRPGIVFFSITGISQRNENHVVVATNEARGSALVLDQIRIFRAAEQPQPSPDPPRPDPAPVTTTVQASPPSSSSNAPPPPPPSSSSIPPSSIVSEFSSETQAPTSSWSARLLSETPSNGVPTPTGSDGNSDSSNTNPEDRSTKSSPNVGAIVGGVLGGLAFICALVLIFFAVKRRRGRPRSANLY